MIPVSYFTHPEDQKALSAMQKIPGFDTLVKTVLKYGYERYLHGFNMASKIRVSRTQLPEIYYRVEKICRKVGVEMPEVYLEMSPVPNAYTMGDNNPGVFMVLTSALFDYLDSDEIDSVIAHEVGHIACHHVLYHTIGQLLQFGLSGILGSIAKFMVEPLTLAILYWDRKSELSADRCAALVCGVDTVVRTQLRLAGGPKTLTVGVNIQEWADQAEEYEKIRNGQTWDKTLQTMATMYQSHPFAAVRVREALNWTKTSDYRVARQYLNS